MESMITILSFLGGLITGAAAVGIPLWIINKNSKTKDETLDKMMNEMKLHFENTANKIFKESSQEMSETNKEKLEEFFKRFRDKIEDFERKNNENYEQEKKNFVVFDQNIKNFIEAGNKISAQTTALSNVMKSDNRKQGIWGEIVLEKVLEASGLRKDEEYKIQSGMAEGRPDATIFLPQDRCVYIDAKTSFSSWESYINCEDEDEKAIHLKQFTDSTKAHIAGLAKRDYSSEIQSPDYVLMFIPIESCYSLLFCEDCALWELAWKNKIMPVSPSTLLAALKIINAFHIVDRQNKNTIEIANICSSMLDKFAALLTELLKIRSNLDTTLKKLNGTGNIINQIKRIEKLGIKMTKDLPEIPEEE